MPVADPQAAQRAVARFLSALDRHRTIWGITSRVSSDIAGYQLMRSRLDDAEREILEQHSVVAEIAARVVPGLDDLRRLRISTNPRQWKFQPILDAARMLHGALEHLEETIAIVGDPMPSPRRLSSPNERASYALVLLQLGAVSPERAVSSKHVGDELGLDRETLDDVETWLNGAGLLQYVTMGPRVCLTPEGRNWAEAGAPSEAAAAPANSTVLNVHMSGGTVRAIQAAGPNAVQSSHVVVNKNEAALKWVDEVRDWLTTTNVSADERVVLLTRLEDLEEELGEPSQDPSRIKRAWTKAKQAFGAVATSAAGSAVGGGLIQAADELDRLL